jgi:Raf kinase inhibitor-like YbhB/YbcL family protein
MAFQPTRPAFRNEKAIAVKYSKDGGNISPPLQWIGVPQGTKSLALVVDDPDAPSGTFVHWVVYGIPPDTTTLDADQPATATLPHGGQQGRNGFGELGYCGPQPPSATHHYLFHLYTLDIDPALPAESSREDVDRAIKDHVLAQAELMGRFQHRKPGSRAA